MRVMDLITALEKMPAGAEVETFIEFDDAVKKEISGVFDTSHISVTLHDGLVQLSTFWDASWGLTFKRPTAKAKKGAKK